MTLLDIITHSPNAWLLYGYLLEKSGGGKELVSVSQQQLSEALSLTRQQVRTATDFLVSNQIVTKKVTKEVTKEVTKGITKANFLQVSNNLLVTLLGDSVSNQTNNQTNNQKTTQKKATKKFKPPTLQQVKDYYIKYATKKGEWKRFNPEAFINYYSSRDWHLSNGKPMQSWQIAITGTWVANTTKLVTITEQQWRMAFNNEKPQIGVGEFLDSNGNRRYKLSNGYATQVVVPLSAPPRADYEQLWSEAQNKWYYE